MSAPRASQKALDDFRNYFAVIRRIRSDAVGESVLRTADILNTKVSALLQHVSIMTAISFAMLIWSRGSDARLDVFDLIMIFEVCGYVVITLLCLRGIWVTDYRSFEGAMRHETERLVAIILNRRATYRAAVIGTFAITLCFMATFVGKLVVSFG